MPKSAPTPEQINAMPAGPEMDALVAERVLGWHKAISSMGGFVCWEENGGTVYAAEKKWSPSTDMNAAMEVRGAMIERLFSVRKRYMENLQTSVSREIGMVDQVVAWSEVFWYVTPLAICRAALLSTLGES